MNGQNTERAGAKKSSSWTWLELLIAFLAVGCILFSTAMAARGEDTASLRSKLRSRISSRLTDIRRGPRLQDAVIPALSAAGRQFQLERITVLLRK
jgi:hypothetical protein